MANLLIVDDDAHIRESLRDRFAARGHDVTTAVDGKDALVKIRRERPDLVLLDLQMPELDGIGVLQKLQQDGIDVTVVVITAFGTVDRAVQAMKNGAYDFIQKPFEPALIEETVKRALERSSLQVENRALRAGKDVCSASVLRSASSRRAPTWRTYRLRKRRPNARRVIQSRARTQPQPWRLTQPVKLP